MSRSTAGTRITTKTYRLVFVIAVNAFLVSLLVGLLGAESGSFTNVNPDGSTSDASDLQSYTASGSRSQDVSHDGWTVQSRAEVKAEANAVVDAYFARYSPEDAAARRANAKLIVKIGNARGFSDRSIAIAVATSIQETGLRNLSWGDRDSLGLYQQRPSVIAWGTAEQILDPSHAIGQFYDRLARITTRDSRTMVDVAIQIQVPNPRYYHRDWQWDKIASAIVAEYSTKPLS